MEVREGMSKVVLTLGPGHTLRDAATRMTEKGVGAAVVIDGSELIGVLSMRDIVRVWTSEGATSAMTSPEAEATASS